MYYKCIICTIKHKYMYPHACCKYHIHIRKFSICYRLSLQYEYAMISLVHRVHDHFKKRGGPWYTKYLMSDVIIIRTVT